MLLLGSCGDKEPDCTTGRVRFTNNSTNSYYLSIDNNLIGSVPGNTFIERDLLEGVHTYKAEQAEGYILWPTVATSTGNVFGCQESQWAFP